LGRRGGGRGRAIYIGWGVVNVVWCVFFLAPVVS